MEEKKRTILAIVISCIILLAVFYSFGLNFFRSTPEIEVADTQAPQMFPLCRALPGRGGSRWR